MNTKNTDPIFEALDRLAGVVDTKPVGDPMPGITRRARANRRRATAFAAGGVTAVVATGLGLAVVVDLPDSAQSPGFTGTPSTPPTSASSTPTSSPREQALAEYDRARADVDGDGAADTIQVLVPEADANEGHDVSMVSKDVRLQVELAAGATIELPFGETLAPTISGTPDLDRDGTAEVVLSFSGGDVAWLEVFTWDGATVVQAEPATGSPADLVDDGGLYSAPEVASAALVDGVLMSWVGTGDMSAPYQVRVWTWQLDDEQLVATEADQLQCFSPDAQHPEPC
jgi:hypothetical protein